MHRKTVDPRTFMKPYLTRNSIATPSGKLNSNETFSPMKEDQELKINMIKSDETTPNTSFRYFKNTLSSNQPHTSRKTQVMQTKDVMKFNEEAHGKGQPLRFTHKSK